MFNTVRWRRVESSWYSWDRLFLFITVYAHNSLGTKRVRLFNKLNDRLNVLNANQVIVVAGGRNCTINASIDRSFDKTRSPPALLLSRVLAENDFIDVWRIQQLGTTVG